MTIVRPPTDNDYHLLALLNNGTQEPHFHATAATMKRDGEAASTNRIVAEQGNLITGMATWFQPDFDRDDRIWTYLHLHPDHREDETAHVLLEAVSGAARKQGATLLWTTVREDYLGASADPVARGFREVHRTFGGGFFLNSPPQQPGDATEGRLREQGVTLHDLGTLVPKPGGDERIHDLYAAVCADKFTAEPTIPAADEHLPVEALWESGCVAIHGDEYVGLALPEPASLGSWNAVLLVRREFRRNGIGTALQKRVVAHLRRQGFGFLNVAGVKGDIAYLTALRRAGASIEPDWISYQLEIR